MTLNWGWPTNPDRPEGSSPDVGGPDPDLTAQYNRLITESQRARFRKEHPKWWAKYSQAIKDNPPSTGGGDTPTDDEEETPDSPETGEPTGDQRDAFALLQSTLDQWGLGSLAGWAWEQVLKGRSNAEILIDLKNQDLYKQIFGNVNSARVAGGHTALSEAAILDYRQNAKRITRTLLGQEFTQEQIDRLLTGDVSLTEWEGRLETYNKFKEFGPAVKAAVSAKLGAPVDDASVFALMLGEKSDPELEKAYEDSIFEFYGQDLGLAGQVTDEMMSELRKRGVSIEQAIQGYQRMKSSMPAIDRLAALDAAVAGDPSNRFNSFGEAWEAFHLQDAESQQNIARLFANEIARFSGGGGAATQGGRALGLLTEEQRRQLAG